MAYPSATARRPRSAYRAGYTPQLPPPRRTGDSRTMLIGGGIALVALVAIVAMWLSHRGAGGIPVVMSDPGPVRVAPANPGGMKPDEVGERMFVRDYKPGEVHLEPPPEAPQAKPR